MDPLDAWVDAEELRRLAEGLAGKRAPSAPGRQEAAYGEGFEGFEGFNVGPGEEPLAVREEEAEAERKPEETAEKEPVAEEEEKDQETRETRAPEEKDDLSRARAQAEEALAAARERAVSAGLVGVGEEEKEPPEEVLEESGGEEAKEELAEEVKEEAPEEEVSVSPFLARLEGFGGWLKRETEARAFFVCDRDGKVLIDEVRNANLQKVARTLANASLAASRQGGRKALSTPNMHLKIGASSFLEVIPLDSRCGPLILGAIVPKGMTAEQAERVAEKLAAAVDGR